MPRFADLLRAALSLLALLTAPTLAAVTSQEDLVRVMGDRLRQPTGADALWPLIGAVVLILSLILAARYYNRRQAHPARKDRHVAARRSFADVAAAMGFRRIEITNLRKIGRRLAHGGDPTSLLATASGRQFLAADMRKRVRRREREVALLQRMLGRLDANVSAAFHDREGVRLEVDIPIWLVKKAPGECPVDDDVVVDIVPVTGKLLDLSEGGAAVSADMPLVAGDLLEFWSADSQIWLPPTKAGVVSLEEEEGDDHVHLHFLDPPLTEIRKAILEIRRLEWEEVEVPADPGEVSAS